MCILNINKDEFKVNSVGELACLLEKSKEQKYCEIWLGNGEEKFLALLKNRDNAFLTFIDNRSNSSFHPVNLDVENNNEKIDFYLSNGQQDFYPVTWTVSFEKGLQALKYFYFTGGLDPNINWSFDS